MFARVEHEPTPPLHHRKKRGRSSLAFSVKMPDYKNPLPWIADAAAAERAQDAGGGGPESKKQVLGGDPRGLGPRMPLSGGRSRGVSLGSLLTPSLPQDKRHFPAWAVLFTGYRHLSGEAT